MSEEKLLTVRDVSIILGVSEKKVMDLAESGSIPAYKIGGVYLRFKKEQIQEFKRSIKHLSTKRNTASQKYLFKERVYDFLYFNDFYFLAAIIIVLLLFIIFKS